MRPPRRAGRRFHPFARRVVELPHEAFVVGRGIGLDGLDCGFGRVDESGQLRRNGFRCKLAPIWIVRHDRLLVKSNGSPVA